MFKSKKGDIEDTLPVLISVVVLVFIILFVGVGKSNAEDKSNELINSELLEIDASYDLINFYRIYGDLIINSIVADNYDELRLKAADYFDSRYKSSNTAWKLSLQMVEGEKETDKVEIMSSNYDSLTQEKYDRKKVASLTLPSLQEDSKLWKLNLHTARLKISISPV